MHSDPARLPCQGMRKAELSHGATVAKLWRIIPTGGCALEPGAVRMGTVDDGRGRTDDRLDVPLTAVAPL